MVLILSPLPSAYRKFQDIDPLAFGINRKGKISFVSVAETLPQLAVRNNCIDHRELIMILWK